MTEFKKFTEINSDNFDEACKTLEAMGDIEDFDTNIELQNEADILDKLIEKYEIENGFTFEGFELSDNDK